MIDRVGGDLAALTVVDLHAHSCVMVIGRASLYLKEIPTKTLFIIPNILFLSSINPCHHKMGPPKNARLGRGYFSG
jgi:hypothetical protein